MTDTQPDEGFVRTEEGRVRTAAIDTRSADHQKLEAALTVLLNNPLFNDYLRDLPLYADTQAWRAADGIPALMATLVEVVNGDS